MPLKVYVIAGEPSGDRLGARLIESLKHKTAGNIELLGVGGAEMAKQGLKSLFPMSELTVMGLAEVLPRLPNLIRRIGETTTDVLSARPDVVVTIDAPDFSLRVAKKLQGEGIPLIHYVAPSVWAWKPGRAKKIAKLVDHLLTLLPFEPPYFEAEGLASTFIGHSVIQSGADKGDGQAFREKHGIAKDAKILCVLPGSRHSEISRLLPIIQDVVTRLNLPGLKIVLPTVETVEAEIRSMLGPWSEDVLVVTGDQEKFAAFAAANGAIAASGTVALELAMAQVPYVTIYKFNALTAVIGRLLVKTKFVNIINILLGREVVPELIQEDCRSDVILPHIKDFLSGGNSAQAQINSFVAAIEMLQVDGELPSDKAADQVLDLVAQRTKLGA